MREFHPISASKLTREKWVPVKRVTPRSAIFDIQSTQHTYTNMVWHPLSSVGIQTLRSPPPGETLDPLEKYRTYTETRGNGVERNHILVKAFVLMFINPISIFPRLVFDLYNVIPKPHNLLDEYSYYLFYFE